MCDEGRSIESSRKVSSLDTLNDITFESSFYNPLVDRKVFPNLNRAGSTLREAGAGEALLDKYLHDESQER
jgi:hypothetical protein